MPPSRKTCNHSKIYDEPPRCVRCAAFVCVGCGRELTVPAGLCGRCADLDPVNWTWHYEVIQEMKPQHAIGQIWQPASPKLTEEQKIKARFRIDEVEQHGVLVRNIHGRPRPRWILARRLRTTRGGYGYELINVLWHKRADGSYTECPLSCPEVHTHYKFVGGVPYAI